MLTLEMLKDMPPGTIFATNITNDPRLYKSPVRWIAKRGNMYDWAIYYDTANKEIEIVAISGSKSFTPAVIKKLVPCNEEAYAMYRF